MLQRIKGTQDFCDLTLYNFFVERTKKHLQLYSFDEISTPVLEATELFKRSLGLHTDVVTKEMYTVCAGESSEDICLRPELTASTMRAFFNNSIIERPWRVFSHGPVFRHERPQKGRWREFHQFNLEVIGAASIAYDAEIIALLDSLFSTTLNVGAYVLRLNFLGSPEDREHYKKELRLFLDKLGTDLPKEIQERKETNLLRVFDLKNPECQKALEGAPSLLDALSAESKAEWQKLQDLLGFLGVSFVVDPRLVRGLDYYNKTVFEFVSVEGLGAQNSFCGGGRYDYLSQTLGEKEAVPSLGVGIGIERVLMLLEQKRAELLLPQKPALTVVLPFGEEQKTVALICAQLLRHHDLCCEVLLDGGSVKSMMRKANKLGARSVVLIGEEEQRENVVTLKNMTTGTEKRVRQDQLVGELKKGNGIEN